MGRWLAPLLPGPQRWVLHDRDADLLEVAAADLPGPTADGAAVTVETRRSDLTRLQARDLADATLITASALLDMLTVDELAALVAVCAGAGCPILLTLSVVGRVELTPADPLDPRVGRCIQRPPAPHHGAGPPARPGRRRGRRRAVRPAGIGGHRPPQPVAPRRRRGRAGGGVVHRLGRCRAPAAGRAGRRGRRLRAPTPGSGSGRPPQVTVDHADLLVLPGW